MVLRLSAYYKTYVQEYEKIDGNYAFGTRLLGQFKIHIIKAILEHTLTIEIIGYNNPSDLLDNASHEEYSKFSSKFKEDSSLLNTHDDTEIERYDYFDVN